MPNDLSQSILQALCFFDVLSWPLTLMEIWQRLDRPAELSAVFAALETPELRRLVEEENGFYFLSGRRELLERRRSAYLLTDKKFKKALAFAGVLKFFPWVRGLAVYSSLATGNPKAGGDIDFFTVAAAGRLWSTRFFINFFLKLFRLRPDEQNKQDKLCFSYLIDEQALNLSVANEGPDDAYYYYHGPGNFLFLYDSGQLAEKIFAANRWSAGNWPAAVSWRRRIAVGRFDTVAERFLAWCPEQLLKKIQLAILPRRFKGIMNRDKRVLVGDRLLKLHDRDQHQAVNEKFRLRFQEVVSGNGRQ